MVRLVAGLLGSGKSTIAHTLLEKLRQRKVITLSPGYTEEERDIVYGAIVLIARLLAENGVNVIIEANANRRKY